MDFSHVYQGDLLDAATDYALLGFFLAICWTCYCGMLMVNIPGYAQPLKPGPEGIRMARNNRITDMIMIPCVVFAPAIFGLAHGGTHWVIQTAVMSGYLALLCAFFWWRSTGAGEPEACASPTA